MDSKSRMGKGRMDDGADSAADLYTAVEVAKLLKVCLATVRRLQQRRELPFVKVGDSVRFSKSDILAYLERNRVDAIDG